MQPGGTAGCVLANRLSNEKDCSVLLIERGDAADGFVDHNPLLSQHWVLGFKHSLEVDSTRNQFLDGRKVTLVTGTGLGGTSRINSMKYTRGAPGEYNLWAQEGRRNWTYEDVEPYFVKSQKWLGPDALPHQGVRGMLQLHSL